MALSRESSKNGTTYYLHMKHTDSRGGKRTLYFFRKEVTSENNMIPLEEVPEGYEVTESPHTGLPLLRKVRD